MMVITTVILFSNHFTFVSGFNDHHLYSVYTFGVCFRILLSLFGLVNDGYIIRYSKKTQHRDFRSGWLMGWGGFWYLALSFIFQKLTPLKDQNQLCRIRFCLLVSTKLRAKLVTKKTKRDILKLIVCAQNQINEKHETLRNNADGT
jgi:hypothetical protein